MSGRYQVPAAVQPLVDSRGLITNPWWAWALSIGKNAGDPIEWSNIVNTPTSLGGYGITDAYTKTQVDSMFSGLAAIYQPLSPNLTAYAGGALPSAFTLSIVDAADAAAWRTAIGAGTSSFDGAFSSLSGIPTTISGYGITDAYTETEVDTLLLDYATITSLAPVAFSGDYDDLTNIPAILGEFTGLANAAGVLTNDGSGNLSWGAGGGTYTAGDGLALAGNEFSVDEAFGFTWTGTHVFNGIADYVGTTTGWSLGRDSGNPAMWSYRAAAAANEKRWAWYHGVESGGAMQLLAWTDDANGYRAAITFSRSGVALTSTVFGNPTDRPDQEFYGKLWAYGAPGVNPFHIVAYSPTSTSYMQARSDALNGEVGYTMTNGTRTWYMFHLGADLRFDAGSGTRATLGASGEWSWAADVWHKDLAGNNRFYFQNNGRIYFGAPTADGSVAYEWRNGANAAVAQMRDDGYFRVPGITNLAVSRWLTFNGSTFTYGSAYVGGASNAWSGLVIDDGAALPTFMSSGSGAGIYWQGDGRWSFFDDNLYVYLERKLLAGVSAQLPYTRITSGGSATGGNITISTSGPSGTPADGDIWIQRAA